MHKTTGHKRQQNRYLELVVDLPSILEALTVMLTSG